MIHSIRKSAASILTGMILLLEVALPAQSRIVKTFRVQVASLSRQSDAESIRQRAVNASTLPVFLDEVQGTYKVTAGDFANYQQALPNKDQLLAKGFEGAFIVEVLSEISDEESTVYKIQVGNFRALANARQLQDQLISRGVKTVSIDRQDDFLKVRVGQYKDYASAAKDAQILQKSGYPDAWVTQVPASEALVERRIISMVAASPASLTPSAPGLQPRQEEPMLYQVAVGPYINQSMAEQVLSDLRSEGFEKLDLESLEGNYWVNVNGPAPTLQADSLKQTLIDKGFWNTAVKPSGKQTQAVAISVPTPTALTTSPSAAPTPALSESQNTALAHLRVARRLMDQRHFEAARDQFRLALDNDPGNVEAAEGYSLALSAIRDSEKFKESTQVGLILELAKKLVQQGEYNAARIQYTLALEKDPQNAAALQGLAEVVEKLKEDTATAQPAEPEQSERPPEQPRLRSLLKRADEEIAAGNLMEARNVLQTAIKDFSTNAQVRNKLAEVNRLIAQQQPSAPAPEPEPEPESGGWFGFLLKAIIFLVFLGGVSFGVYRFKFYSRPSGEPQPSLKQVHTLMSKLGIGAKQHTEPGREKTTPPAGLEEQPITEKSAPKAAAPRPKVPEKPSPPPVEEKSAAPTLSVDAWPKPRIVPAEEPSVEEESRPPATARAEPIAPSEAPREEPPLQPVPKFRDPVRREETKPAPAPHLLSEEEVQAYTQNREATQLVFEQNFDSMNVGETPENWKGQYERASLSVSQNPLIAGPHKYLKFLKEVSEEETLFCALIPDTGRRPIFEFELCCLGVNQATIGLYLESVESEEISLGARFQTDPTTQQLVVRLGDHSLPYVSGQWQTFRFEMDIDAGRYRVLKDKKIAIEDATLPPDVAVFDLISLKAQPQAEGTLLLKNLSVRQLDNPEGGE